MRPAPLSNLFWLAGQLLPCRHRCSLMLAVVAVTAGLSLTGAQARGANPSFDCGATLNHVERVICSDEMLGYLDREMATAYALALREVGGNQPRLVGAQRRWLKEREKCLERPDDAETCLAALYRDRLTAIAVERHLARKSTEPPRELERSGIELRDKARAIVGSTEYRNDLAKTSFGVLYDDEEQSLCSRFINALRNRPEAVAFIRPDRVFEHSDDPDLLKTLGSCKGRDLFRRAYVGGNEDTTAWSEDDWENFADFHEIVSGPVSTFPLSLLNDGNPDAVTFFMQGRCLEDHRENCSGATYETYDLASCDQKAIVSVDDPSHPKFDGPLSAVVRFEGQYMVFETYRVRLARGIRQQIMLARWPGLVGAGRFDYCLLDALSPPASASGTP